MEKNEKDLDCRAIPNTFYDRFADKNDLGKFVDLVLKHKELELLFRGNSSDEGMAVVYRNNHAMFIIRPQTVEFNPNYLRYDPNWNATLDMLMKIYTKRNRPTLCAVTKKINKKGIPSYSCSFGSKRIIASIDSAFLNALCNPVKELDDKSLYDIFSEIFDIFFCKDDERYSIDQFLVWANRYDSKYAGEVVQVRGKSNYLEKKRQQQLFHIMRNQEDGYYFYDMEFAEKGKTSGDKNKPDMQAIRFEKGKPKAWVFVEVKSTVSACGGDSGLDKHVPRMLEYIDDKNNIIKRKREALLLFHQYQELGLFSIKREIDPREFDLLNPEVIVIFTDEAKKCWRKYKTIYDETSEEVIKLEGKENTAILVKGF